VLQRFISKDPAGYAGGSINLYIYVDNDPMNLTDPTGLSGGANGAGEGYGAPQGTFAYPEGISELGDRPNGGSDQKPPPPPPPPPPPQQPFCTAVGATILLGTNLFVSGSYGYKYGGQAGLGLGIAASPFLGPEAIPGGEALGRGLGVLGGEALGAYTTIKLYAAQCQ